MELPSPSKLSVRDEEAVAYAVGETFKMLIKGISRQGFAVLSAENVMSLLYYNINPYATEPSFATLQEICRYMRAE